MELLITISIGLLAGTLIGTVGIGGVLLAPLLNFFLDVDVHQAMASSSLSFLFTAVVGIVSYARRGSISWEMVKWLSLGVLPAAILGAWVNSQMQTSTLFFILAVLILFSGLNTLTRRSLPHKKPSLGNLSLVLIGLGVGFGSALTGTGGPVILVPLLVLLNFSPLIAIGVSQAIQLPVALFATFGFALYGDIDWQLGITLGIIQAAGVLMGAHFAHRLPLIRLRQVVAMALIGVGLLMIRQNLS